MRHQKQLDGSMTSGEDCGVRTTSMAIDWATRGVKVPSVKVVRTRMGKPSGTTNPLDWETCIESFDTSSELGGKYEPPLSGERVNGGPWTKFSGHLASRKLIMLAVDYGVYRRLMPRKAGSKSFSGYHAIPFLPRSGKIISFDPLLDGRYRGCPRGPVPVDITKVRQAAEAVGMKEGVGKRCYGFLPEKAVVLGGVPIPPPEPDEAPVTLAAILADLYEMLDQGMKVQGTIDDLEALIGPYQGEAEPDDEPAEGVTT